MSKRFRIRNIGDKELNHETALFIYCVGFETRSRFIAQKKIITSQNTLAVVYDNGRTLSFDDNVAFTKEQGFPTVDDQKENLEERLKITIARIKAHSQRLHVTVDVSSMNRAVMASTLIAILDEMGDGDALRVLYAPSEYKDPKLELLPINRIGAAHPRISGEVGSPRNSRVLLLGLGYEYGVSLNVLDSHEPDISFIFRPRGFDERFTKSVEDANFGFDFGEREYEIIDYHLADASALYDEISSLVVSLKHGTSILAVPLGPKLLSAVMILVGYVHQPSVSVLRYSMASLNYHYDVTAAGMVVGFEVVKIASRQPQSEFSVAFGV